MKIEDIVMKTQAGLKKALMAELNRMGYRTRTKKGFIYVKGSVPVLLVAHLDTVHKQPVKTICYSLDGKIMMSPEGIGGDDRAGVYMILQIIKKHRCHVLFCEDEEVGGVGAKEFAESGIIPDVNYIVELDRRGKNDAVFYDCDNPDFTRFICRFGFEEEFGSFSDISVIAPHLGVAAVNISAGYHNEHTRYEYINLESVVRNIDKVNEMIDTPSERFEYIEAIRYRGLMTGRSFYEDAIDFDRYYGGVYDGDYAIELSPLPDSAFIKHFNEMIECDGQFYINRHGKVFELFDDLDIAVEVDGAEAFSEQGLPAKFDEKKAVHIDVMDEEYVYDYLYGLGQDDEDDE